MRVLLVDDEADLASALAERLDLRGFQADWATTGDEALDKAAANVYEIAILDLKMPKTGGVELKAKLLALCPQMKFIFLTGYGSEKDFKTISGEIGDANYLVKPVDIQVLIERMHYVLKKTGEK